MQWCFMFARLRGISSFSLCSSHSSPVLFCDGNASTTRGSRSSSGLREVGWDSCFFRTKIRDTVLLCFPQLLSLRLLFSDASLHLLVHCSPFFSCSITWFHSAT